MFAFSSSTRTHNFTTWKECIMDHLAWMAVVLSALIQLSLWNGQRRQRGDGGVGEGNGFSSSSDVCCFTNHSYDYFYSWLIQCLILLCVILGPSMALLQNRLVDLEQLQGRQVCLRNEINSWQSRCQSLQRDNTLLCQQLQRLQQLEYNLRQASELRKVESQDKQQKLHVPVHQHGVIRPNPQATAATAIATTKMSMLMKQVESYRRTKERTIIAIQATFIQHVISIMIRHNHHHDHKSQQKDIQYVMDRNQMGGLLAIFHSLEGVAYFSEANFKKIVMMNGKPYNNNVLTSSTSSSSSALAFDHAAWNDDSDHDRSLYFFDVSAMTRIIANLLDSNNIPEKDVIFLLDKNLLSVPCDDHVSAIVPLEIIL